jgi:hypothetical protein
VAQAPAGPPGFVEVPLTEAMIQSFIATYPMVKATTATIIARYNVTAAASLDDDTARLTLNAARNQLNAAVAIYGGYTDYEAWTNIAMSVAFAVERAGGRPVDPKIARLGTPVPGTGALPLPVPPAAALPPPAANVDAVRPYVAELQALLTP